MNFEKVLVANRGEIAVRVIRGCKKMGYRTVAVYADADRHALHVSEADEAVCIGPSPAVASYLVIEKIIQAAIVAGAGAVHPGVGFLSERAAFATAVQDAGLVFIGPDPESIEAMGNKSTAKIRMIAAGVPCVPGYQGEDQTDATLVAESLKIGLPVMVKAAAGGGGRGMRLVREESGLLANIQSARSEAANAFGDGQLLVEKAVLDARHVEIQVFGDRHGNVVHFGERDCSVQRRNQKVVEEAPSPAVGSVLRARMGAAAVAAAKAVHYVGAGTVEFMLAKDGAFYFLEMNTRLQVEHPVTELVFDVDLVEWQLRIARDEALPLSQDEIDARRKGWAIEARLCTEDPANDFLPQTGPVLAWRPPAGCGTRVDHGLRQGGEITPFYDSMQAKLIAWGETREQARLKLLRMLDEVVLLGVNSNRDFLMQLIAHPVFAAGEFSTGFIAEHFPQERMIASRTPDRLHVALAAALYCHFSADALGADAGIAEELLNWQSSAPAATAVTLATGTQVFAASVTPTGGRRYAVNLPDGPLSLELSQVCGVEVEYLHEGRSGCAHVARAGNALWLDHNGRTLCYTDQTFAVAEKSDAGGDARLTAPMDGRIVAVLADAGAAISKGQLLAVLEAMKMEFPIASRRDGVIETISCQVGQQVKARQILVTLHSETT